MPIEEMLGKKTLKRDDIDYSFPFNSTRFFKVNEDEEDVTIREWKPSQSMDSDIEDPRKNSVIIKMIIGKYESEMKKYLSVSEKHKQLVINDFKNDKINEEDVVLFWDASDNVTTYLAFTKDCIFGVNNNSDKCKIGFDDLSALEKFIKDNYKIEISALDFNNRLNTLKLIINEIKIMSDKPTKIYDHFMMQKDIHFREDYIAILYNMLLSDGRIYAKEINALYAISNALDIKNKDFLKIVNIYCPFDANKTSDLIFKHKNELFLSFNKYVLIKDLILIIFSDGEMSRDEKRLLDKICLNLDIEHDLIDKLCNLYLAIAEQNSKKKEKENDLLNYMIKNNLNDEIKKILI